MVTRAKATGEAGGNVMKTARRSLTGRLAVTLALATALSLTGCLGDFLSSAQIDAKLDAYAASLDIDALGSDASTPDTLAGDSTATDGLGGCDSDIECDDGDACTADICHKDGTCTHKAATDGAGCDDGNACTLSDKCLDGVCTGGSAKDCSDGNDCTYDACQIASGCTHTNDDGAACNDADPCTLKDKCSGGSCSGAPVNCGADDCTTAKCWPNDVAGGAAYKCTTASKIKGLKCDDKNACTTGTLCDGFGLCVGGTLAECEDKNACTADSCEALAGCTHDLLTDACSDGNACTVGDQCEAGSCKGGTAKGCDDGIECTGDVCNPVSGACETTATTAACSDGNPCTQGDQCQGGKCQPGAAAQCDDNNACTEDACDPQSGACTHVDGSGGCEDGNGCTVGDTCKNGKCASGGEKTCLDTDTCTADSCDPKSGNCAHSAIAGCGAKCGSDGDCQVIDVCSTPACLSGACAYLPTSATCTDGDACTQGDYCQFGACKHGASVNCDDGNPCTDDSCNGGTCSHSNSAASCSDGDSCTVGDTCSNGACNAGKAKVCDDGNLCTTDACDPQSGNCSAAPNAAACDDQSPCSMGDVCKGGTCSAGPAKNCDDGNGCTADACDPSTGNCGHSATAAPCDDGNACSEGDVCAGGGCSSGAPKYCDDQNPCTNDTCDPSNAVCGHVANAATCSDGDACTIGDVCKDAACKVGASMVCSDAEACTNDACDPSSGNCVFKPITSCGGNCTKPSDCSDANPCTDDNCTGGKCAFPPNTTACSDGDACTGGDICGGGACKSGSPKNCDDGNPCTDDSCNPTSGNCTYAPNTANCDDANACTSGDACGGGVCKPGSAKGCSDGKVCTDDTCDPVNGSCKNYANTAICDDGSACTLGDVCSGGQCLPGTAASCDDSNPCTSDSCDATSGKCSHSNNTAPCSDGSACSIGDVCGGGACLPGTAKTCNDGNACTSDACDTSTGACVYTANSATCDDGNACTSGDKCAAGSCVSGTAKACSDGDTCTADSCDASSSLCIFAPIVGCGGNCTDASACNDGNPCTDDTCVNKKCSFPANTGPCSDNNACTSGDICAAGTCAAGSALNCDDGNPCTNDSCDSANGTCGHVNATGNCTDNNACTKVDLCQNGKCVAGIVQVCDDNNACTDDACNPTTGLCVYTNNVAACSDGNACTTGDACAAGTCTGGAAPNCDDGNPCTIDTCDPTSGCKKLNNTASCSDGNACTVGDTCSGGSCAGGSALVCNDNNLCTTDTCDSASGCKYANNTTSCDDGNKCTKPDACTSGACSGTAVSCDDGDKCTTDSCNPASGVCVFTPMPGCGGYCAFASDCSDNNACTDDVCVSSKCAFNNNTGACDDGSVCTKGDLCSGGKCLAGSAISCDDNSACTNDSCDATTGCAHVNNTAVCNDANPCTAGDVCSGGVCAGPATVNCDDSNPCTDDACAKTTGCTHAANTATCDDGSKCTANDVCSGGTCSGKAISCDDGNACTADSCNKSVGCVSVAVSDGGVCSDGNPCTVGDGCLGGSCVAKVGTNACDDSNPCTSDVCTSQASGQFSCSHSNLPSSTLCSAPTSTAYGFCRNGACTGVEQVTAVAAKSTANRLRDIGTDHGGAITTVGSFAGSLGALTGVAYTVDGGSTPPTLNQLNYAPSDELFTVRGRLITGGHTTTVVNTSVETAFTAAYGSGSPPWSTGGPFVSLPARILRTSGLATDTTSGGEAGTDDYLLGGSTVGPNQASSNTSPLYHARASSAGAWDTAAGEGLGQMLVINSTTLGAGNLCPAATPVNVSGIYRPTTGDAFLTINDATSGFVAYWSAKQAQNANCTTAAPGGVVDLAISGPSSGAGTMKSGALFAIDGTSSTNVMAVGTSDIRSFDGSKWTDEAKKLTGISISGSSYMPQVVAVSDTEAFVGGSAHQNGCYDLFILHATKSSTGWTWDSPIVTTTTLHNCDSAATDVPRLSRAWLQPKTNNLYLVGMAGMTSTGSTVALAKDSVTTKASLLLRIK